MAAETGIPSVYLEHQLSHGKASKKNQETIIEKLRHKNSQMRNSWTDSIKSVRSLVAERKTLPEKAETTGVQHCLDTLQKAMKVISLQTMKERLDLIGRQLGLNSQVQDQKVSLGTDAFHVEVMLEDSGGIANVKLANQGDVVDCPDLKDVLMKGDFTEFIEHLQGLQNIYQVTSDEKLKSKAFLALQALEKDLNQLAQFQSSISGVANYIHKCPLGIMLPRSAGKPMKLIYFVSPYDLLDKKSLTAHPLTVEAITENFLGQSVTVCIESVPDCAPSNKLQTMPLMIVSKTQDGKSLPSFSAVSKINSMMLPANFVLVLPQNVPVSLQILQKISSQTGLEIHKEANTQSLRSLILQSFSGGKIEDSRQLSVSLPDQQHIYFLDGLSDNTPEQQGVLVSRIPFTHPTHVPQILNLMRQQLLFNIVIASCIRPEAKREASTSIVFEITAVSLQHITIVFEHPAYDSMVTVDMDLSDITNLKCSVVCTNTGEELCSDDALSRVFQRCMSIPIMLRWLIGRGRGHLDKLKEEAALNAEKERLEKELFLKEMQYRQAKFQPTAFPANRPPPQPPHPPPLPPPPSYHQHLHSPMLASPGSGQPSTMHPLMTENQTPLSGPEDVRSKLDPGRNDRLYMTLEDEPINNPLLSTLLDEDRLPRAGSQPEVSETPMLSRLLDENISVATTVIPMNCKIAPPVTKRQRKRRNQSDSSGPSSKHHISDMNSTDHLNFLGSPMDLDLGPVSMDQGLPHTPPIMGSMALPHASSGYHSQHPIMLNHSSRNPRLQPNVIDLTEAGLVGESSLKKLAEVTDSVDKHFIHKDMKAEPDLSMLLHEAETPNRIHNILQNSPSGSKNENASTSLEGLLTGSGEVGRAKDFDPSDVPSVHSSTTPMSKLSTLLLSSTDTTSANFSLVSHQSSSFFRDKLANEDGFNAVGGTSLSDGNFPQDVKPSPASIRKNSVRHSSSVDLTPDRDYGSGVFDKFDIPRQQQTMKIETANSEVKLQPIEGKVSLKLIVGNVKQQNSVKPYVKSYNSVDETFDFKSDEDDDGPLVQRSSDRYVFSSSPTHLHISGGKQRRLSDYSLTSHKSEKTKKKDKSGITVTKRKRDKEESKREKKRKKNEHFFQESVYRTVENDAKADFKLKIRVAKKPVTDKSGVHSDGRVPSYEIKKRLPSSLEKSYSSKQEGKEAESVVSEYSKDKETVADGGGASRTIISKLSTHGHKSSPKSGSSKNVSGGGSTNKTDPKLVTKATIRLKPLMMPNSGSTVNVSQSGQKTPSTMPLSSKSDRRSSTSVAVPTSDKRSAATHNSILERRSSVSNLVERRSATQPSQIVSPTVPTTPVASTSVTTPTTVTSANLSLSSILPNAPTTSKVASMPRIPKLSSSSSNTSISRTSSLDPGAGSLPTSAGTKSNNSYTTGPAGRPSQGVTSGPGSGRPSTGQHSALNFNSRPPAPNSGGAGSNRLNFNSSRLSGAAQTSPVAGSSHSGSHRLPGPRTHYSSVGGNNKAGVSPLNSQKSVGNFSSVGPVRGITGGSGSNPSQKIYAAGAKLNSSINSKNGGNVSGPKMAAAGSGSGSGGQKLFTQNSHSAGNTWSSAGTSGLCRSPTTAGLTRSPNAGKSPNIASAGKSPSLNNASRSPNLSAISKSPNISSSGPGRSPNSRSPNVHMAVKPAPSPSHPRKSPVSSSHRHSSGQSKSSSVVNKSASLARSHSSSPSQRSFNTMSSSSKSLQAKPDNKTTSCILSNSHLLPSGRSASLSALPVDSLTNSQSNTIGTPPVTSSSNLEQSLSISCQKSSVLDQPSVSVSSAVSETSTALVTDIDSHAGHVTDNDLDVQDLRGSKIHAKVSDSLHAVLPEKCTAPAAIINTHLNLDPTKCAITLPSVRGRKNSLSAIVDKLKSNAVSMAADSPVFSEGYNNVSHPLAGVNCENTPENKPVNDTAQYAQKEHGTSSPLGSNAENAFLNVDKLDKKHNHLLGDTFVQAMCEKVTEASLINTLSKISRKDTTVPIKINDIFPLGSCEQNAMDKERGKDIVLKGELIFDLARHKDEPSIHKQQPVLSEVPEVPALSRITSHQASPVSSPGSLVQPGAEACISNMSHCTYPFQATQPSGLSSESPKAGLSANASEKLASDEPSSTVAVVSCADQQCEDVGSAGIFDGRCSESHIDLACHAGMTEPRDNPEFSNDPRDLVGASDKDLSACKPLSCSLSDISSPENDLVIDEELVYRAAKFSRSGISDKHTAVRSQALSRTPDDLSTPADVVNAGNKSASPPAKLDGEGSEAASPTTQAKSPGLRKSSFSASASKESDSPCPIDDDLMDEALGFGS